MTFFPTLPSLDLPARGGLKLNGVEVVLGAVELAEGEEGVGKDRLGRGQIVRQASHHGPRALHCLVQAHQGRLLLDVRLHAIQAARLREEAAGVRALGPASPAGGRGGEGSKRKVAYPQSVFWREKGKRGHPHSEGCDAPLTTAMRPYFG